MESDVNSKEILYIKFPKIREKVFLQSLDRRMNEIKKRIYFRTLHYFALCHGILLPPVPTQHRLVGHPNVHIHIHNSIPLYLK